MYIIRYSLGVSTRFPFSLSFSYEENEGRTSHPFESLSLKPLLEIFEKIDRVTSRHVTSLGDSSTNDYISHSRRTRVLTHPEEHRPARFSRKNVSKRTFLARIPLEVHFTAIDKDQDRVSFAIGETAIDYERVICTERRFSSALLTCHLCRYAVPLFYNPPPSSSTAAVVSRSRAARALLVERLRFSPHSPSHLLSYAPLCGTHTRAHSRSPLTTTTTTCLSALPARGVIRLARGCVKALSRLAKI